MKLLALMTTIFAASACHGGSRTEAAGPTSPTVARSAPTPSVTATTEAAPTNAAKANLRAQRAQMIRWLHDYTEAGQFPTDHSGLPLSVFVDANGVRCPMAELIFRSGHPELVDAVAREHNAVRLSEVNEGPLLAWMQSSGLTRAEINMIQGIADIDYMWMQEMPSEPTILARGQIRGRLETAERALRDNTAHSLDVAVAALPNGKLPDVAFAADTKLLPAAALTSGPSGRPLTAVRIQPRVRRARGLDFRSLQVAPNGSLSVVRN